MNVYDFDGTIYDGDSSADLIKYLLAHYPRTWLYLVPTAVMYGGYLLHFWDKAKGKSGWYGMMRCFKDPEAVVKAFWDQNEKKIFPFYFARQKPDDLITSASPLFHIREICNRLGIKNVIASPVDIHTGKPEGPNNDGARKVETFKERFPDAVIEEFYSDSRHDRYLASMAKKAFLTRHGKPQPW